MLNIKYLFLKDNLSIRGKCAKEMFYTNLCNKKQPSIGESYYFLLLKDNYSRYYCLFLRRENLEIFNYLK